MNIDRIKNYNQKILAIFATLGAALTFVLLLWALVVFVTELLWMNNDTTAHEIVSTEVAQANFDKSLRTHRVSFESIRLIDSVNSIFLIPVSQTALSLEEYIDKQNRQGSSTLGLPDTYGSFDNEFYYNSHSYNNALLFDSKTASVTKIFNQRVSINKIYHENIFGKTYILFAVTSADTNKDGLLNKDDNKALYVFSTAKMELRHVNCTNCNFIQYHNPDGKYLIINYGLDKNNDGTYNWDEPVVMKKYNVETDELKNLIEPRLVNELQLTLDGE